MKTRDEDLVRQEAQSSDNTSKSWKLDGLDTLSALFFEFQGTNGTTSNKGNFISDVIKKIEIISGSTPLVSVNMFELEFLHFLKTGQTPGMFPSGWPSGIQRHGAMLMFGRRLWDPDFGFLPSKYKNPKLQITWNLGAVRDVSATTAFATGTLKITACAKVMEDAPAPSRYLAAKQVDTFTMDTSGSHKSDLPCDYPWRLMLVRSYLQLYDINEMIERLSINFDTGKYKPLDERYVADLDAEALALFGRSTLKHDLFTSDNEANRILHNKEPDCRVWDAHATTPDILGIIYQWSNDLKLSLLTNAGVQDTTDRKVTMVEEGHGMHSIVPVPFGRMDDPASWLDAKKYAGCDLRLYVPSGGGYAGVSSVVLEQSKPNGE